jgi:hypothetical protein
LLLAAVSWRFHGCSWSTIGAVYAIAAVEFTYHVTPDKVEQIYARFGGDLIILLPSV